MRSFFNLVLLLCVAAVSAVSSAGQRLLVLMDDVAEKTAYNTFFGDLKDRGFEITYETPRAEALHLFNLGQRNYDHLLFLPTKIKGLGPNLTPNILLEFVKAEGNVLVTMSSTHGLPTSLVSLLSELEISLPTERTGTVVDHFNYDITSAAEKHDILVLDAPNNVRSGIKPYFENPGAVLVAPHVVGHVLGSSQLLTPIIRAPATAYSYNPKEQGEVVDPEDLFAAGQQLALASTVQARNSARVAVLGSAEMLEDKWFTAKVGRPGVKAVEPANRDFAKSLTGWAFKEIGVVRVNEIEHRLHGDNATNPEIYRVKNDVDYSISISEYSWDKWVPFTLPDDDVLQLEFSMLSPFHRLNLAAKEVTDTETTFGITFTLPDQHGIFNFKVNYKRPFITNLEEKNTVSVRHMAHDEWPRSYVISGAWPWISGIGATVTGFLAFSALWMYSKPVKNTTSAKKTQ